MSDNNPDIAVEPDEERYTRVAVILHWLIALLILFNLAVGPFMEGLPRNLRPVIVGWHVSSGITVFALTMVRIGWRLFHPPPPALPGATWWEARLAKAVHILLYGLMIAMPLTDWMLISANPPPGVVAGPPSPRGRPPVIWGLIRIPLIAPIQQIGATAEGVATQKKLHDDFVRAHALSGFTMMALVALHILGALKHELLDGRELRRMTLPSRRRRKVVVPDQAP